MARWSWLILAFYVVLAVSAQDSTSSTLDKVAGETTTAANSEVKTVKTTTSRTKATNGTTTQLTTETDAPTTTEATTTSTVAPTTTTKAPTTAVPAPTPEPPKWPENIGQWNVTDAKNKSIACLILHAALEVNLKITEDKKTSTVNVLVPKTAVANGTCGDETNAIELNWSDNFGISNVLKLTFKKNNVTQGKEGYALSEIHLSVNNNGTQTTGNSNASTPHFQTPISQSYRCSKETPIPIQDDIELRVSSLQLEAFRTVPNDKFNEALECSGDDVSAVVPFAVGASLALLVVIVLIAYLIGRRRSRARGYQSV